MSYHFCPFSPKLTNFAGPVSPVSVSSLAPPAPPDIPLTRSVSAEAIRQITRRATLKRVGARSRSFRGSSVSAHQLEAIQKSQKVLDARLKVCCSSNKILIIVLEQKQMLIITECILQNDMNVINFVTAWSINSQT